MLLMRRRPSGLHLHLAHHVTRRGHGSAVAVYVAAAAWHEALPVIGARGARRLEAERDDGVRRAARGGIGPHARADATEGVVLGHRGGRRYRHVTAEARDRDGVLHRTVRPRGERAARLRAGQGLAVVDLEVLDVADRAGDLAPDR